MAARPRSGRNARLTDEQILRLETHLPGGARSHNRPNDAGPSLLRVPLRLTRRYRDRPRGPRQPTDLSTSIAGHDCVDSSAMVTPRRA